MTGRAASPSPVSGAFYSLPKLALLSLSVTIRVVMTSYSHLPSSASRPPPLILVPRARNPRTARARVLSPHSKLGCKSTPTSLTLFL